MFVVIIFVCVWPPQVLEVFDDVAVAPGLFVAASDSRHFWGIGAPLVVAWPWLGCGGGRPPLWSLASSLGARFTS